MEKAYPIGKVLKVNKQNAITGSGLRFEGERQSHYVSTEQKREHLPGLWLWTRIGPTENLDGILKLYLLDVRLTNFSN